MYIKYSCKLNLDIDIFEYVYKVHAYIYIYTGQHDEIWTHHLNFSNISSLLEKPQRDVKVITFRMQKDSSCIYPPLRVLDYFCFFEVIKAIVIINNSSLLWVVFQENAFIWPT